MQNRCQAHFYDVGHNSSLQFDTVSVCLSYVIHGKSFSFHQSSHLKCSYRFNVSPPMQEWVLYSVHHFSFSPPDNSIEVLAHLGSFPCHQTIKRTQRCSCPRDTLTLCMWSANIQSSVMYISVHFLCQNANVLQCQSQSCPLC